MEKVKALIQHIAPTLASALSGPFSGVASKFIIDNLVKDDIPDGITYQKLLSNLLNDSNNLQKVKVIDEQFRLEMQKLDVDIFALETTDKKEASAQTKIYTTPQMLISILFLVTYFLMMTVIFAVEVSDSFNMSKGENSLMGELEILIGVLTAGVGQILSFWFGGVLGKKNSPEI